jgi:uncharacterized protein YceK
MRIVFLFFVLCLLATGCSSIGRRLGSSDSGPMVNPGPYQGVRSNLDVREALKEEPARAVAMAPITIPDFFASAVLDTALIPIDIWSLGRRVKTTYQNSGKAGGGALDVFTMRYNRHGQLDGESVLVHHLSAINYSSVYKTWGESPVIIQHIHFKNGVPEGEAYSSDVCETGGPIEIARGTYRAGKESSGTFFVRDKKVKGGGYILRFIDGRLVSKQPFQHQRMGNFN